MSRQGRVIFSENSVKSTSPRCTVHFTICEIDYFGMQSEDHYRAACGPDTTLNATL
ncbi:hypothetical protein PATSB16_29300 [Pandoraea thiooxydans]|nr:hypothetical protein PATSB16_29300 [Pandoraea thiooxydans]